MNGTPGGGIYNAGTLTLNDSTVTGNRTGDGYQISDGDYWEDEWHESNGVGGNGGGIFNTGALVIRNSTLSENETGVNIAHGSDEQSGANGGGLFNQGTVTIDNSTINDNTAGDGVGYHYYGNGSNAGDGGGIYNTGTMSITNSTLNNNVAGDAHGSVGDVGDSGDGGGIYNTGDLTIRSTRIRHNTTGAGGCIRSNCAPAGYGGAIFNSGTLTMTESDLDSNTTDHEANSIQGRAHGAGLYNNGVMTIERCRIRNNKTASGSEDAPMDMGNDGGSGGGAFNDQAGELKIRDSIIENNATGKGGVDNGGDGGGVFNAGDLTVEDSIIRQNTTGNDGRMSYGRAGLGGGFFNQGTLRITRSTITENHTGENSGYHHNLKPGGSGGGIFNVGELIVSDSLVSGNSTSDCSDDALPGNGGGIFNGHAYDWWLGRTYGTMTIINTTISGNTTGEGGSGPTDGQAGAGGGIFTDEDTTTTLHNSIIWGNNAHGNGDQVGGESGETTMAYSLIEDLFPDGEGNLDGTAIDDPGFVDAANGDLHLRENSPAINAGSNALVPDGVFTDLDGNQRVVGSSVDMGAYEYQSMTCASAIDVMLVLDSSHSIDADEFALIQQFAQDLMVELKASSPDAHIGIVQFSGQGQGRLESGLIGNTDTLSATIAGLSHIRGRTDMQEGLFLAQEELRANGRDDVPRFVFLLTDGYHNEKGDPVSEALTARAEGSEIFVLGVGNDLSIKQLQQMASDPTLNHFFLAEDFANLTDVLDTLVGGTCNATVPGDITSGIQGTVTDADGEALGGISVRLYQQNGDEWGYVLRKPAITDANGHYAIPDLEAGTYRVKFVDMTREYVAEYYGGVDAFDQALNITMKDNKVVTEVNGELDLAVPPLVRIESAGHTIPDPRTGQVRERVARPHMTDVTIQAQPTCTGNVSPTNVTLWQGTMSYSMSEQLDPAGAYAGTIPQDDLTDDATLRVTWACGDTAQDQTVGRIDLYDPSGNVTDAQTGQAVSDAHITLYYVPEWRPQTDANDTAPNTCQSHQSKAADEPWSQPAPVELGVLADNTLGQMDPPVETQVTGADGYYGWDVAEGCWYVVAEAEGYRTLVSPVVGVPPEVTDLHLALEPIAADTTSDSPGVPTGSTPTIATPAPLTPNTPAAPDAPDTDDTTNTPDAPDTDDTTNTPDAPDTDDTTNTPDAPDTDDTTNTPDAPDTDDTTNTPDAPDTDDTTNTPDAPDTDDTTNTPDAPTEHALYLPAVVR